MCDSTHPHAFNDSLRAISAIHALTQAHIYRPCPCGSKRHIGEIRRIGIQLCWSTHIGDIRAKTRNTSWIKSWYHIYPCYSTNTARVAHRSAIYVLKQGIRHESKVDIFFSDTTISHLTVEAAAFEFWFGSFFFGRRIRWLQRVNEADTQIRDCALSQKCSRTLHVQDA